MSWIFPNTYIAPFASIILILSTWDEIDKSKSRKKSKSNWREKSKRKSKNGNGKEYNKNLLISIHIKELKFHNFDLIILRTTICFLISFLWLTDIVGDELEVPKKVISYDFENRMCMLLTSLQSNRSWR